MAAVQRRGLHAGADFLKHAGYLHHQLAARRNHHGLDAPRGRTQYLQHRQYERQCLARSRGRQQYDVLGLTGRGHHPFLHIVKFGYAESFRYLRQEFFFSHDICDQSYSF